MVVSPSILTLRDLRIVSSGSTSQITNRQIHCQAKNRTIQIFFSYAIFRITHPQVTLEFGCMAVAAIGSLPGKKSLWRLFSKAKAIIRAFLVDRFPTMVWQILFNE
jgi:hypothetical protein